MHRLSTNIIMFKRAGRLHGGSEKVRTAGKRTILCYIETNPTQVSILNTFLSAQFTYKEGDCLASVISFQFDRDNGFISYKHYYSHHLHKFTNTK